MMEGTYAIPKEQPPLTLEAMEAAIERLKADFPQPDTPYYEIPVHPDTFDDAEKLRKFGERLCDFGPKGAVYTLYRDVNGIGAKGERDERS